MERTLPSVEIYRIVLFGSLCPSASEITVRGTPLRNSCDDLKTYMKDLGKFINNYHTHHKSKIDYELIPEHHKDGAWHMHGLLHGILPKHLITNENGYLDFPMYSKKFGYCSLSPVRDHEAVSKYITKYITKDLANRSLGERLYYCSKGLNKPKELFRLENVIPDFIDWDFEHEDGYCRTAMVDNFDFMQNICIDS